MIPVPRRPGRMSRQLHAPKQIFLLGPGEIRKVNSGNRRGSGGNADHRIRAASTSRRSSGLPAMGGARLRSGAGHSLSSRRSPARRAAFTATAPRSEARAQASGPDRSCCTGPPTCASPPRGVAAGPSSRGALRRAAWSLRHCAASSVRGRPAPPLRAEPAAAGENSSSR